MFTTDLNDILVIHTADSAVTLDDIARAMQGWFEHPDFDPEKPVLWDLRRATLAISVDDLDAWSEKMVRVANRFRSGRKSAWVFPTAEAADVAVDVLGSHDWQNRVRIFQNDYEAARAWLTSIIR